jgi:RHS repeat-associated protein
VRTLSNTRRSPFLSLNRQTTAQTFTVLSKVTFPSGGSVSYGYPANLVQSPCGVNEYLPVISRSVDANDGTGPHTWTYSYNASTGVTTVTDPLGNQSLHTFTSYCYPYESQTQQKDSHGNVLKTINTVFSSIADTSATWVGPLDVYPTSVTTIWPNGQQSRVSMIYDRDNGVTFRFGTTTNLQGILWSTQQSGYTSNPWTVTETDFGQGAPGAVLRTTNTSYLGYTNPNYPIRKNLVSSVQVQDGSGVQRAYTTYGYDESGLQPSNVSEQHVAGQSYPGNQTSVHRWLSNGSAVSQSPCSVSVASGGYLVTNRIFYDTGEVQQITDPCLYLTSYQYSSTNFGAYPTTVTNALSQSATYGYDFNTGLVTSTTDPNLQPTTKTYDVMGRLTQVNYPDGGQTTYCYTDLGGATCSQASAPPYAVVTTKKITSSLNETSTNIFDGLGRVIQTQLNSDPDGVDYVDTTYDADGRKATVSNSHRSTSSTTDGTTTYVYDALGRVCVTVPSDGTAVSGTCPTARPAKDTFSSYTGNCTTMTDEAGKSRKSCVDGLGRMTGVWEDPSSSNYETDYQYNTLGDLTSVTQKGSNSANARIRTFQYDSISRLTSASNPESGNITYSYDADGNVVTKTGPRPNQTGSLTVRTTNTYDKLNRLAKKSYVGMTMPTIQYGYDAVALSGCSPVAPNLTDSYPIGRRTSICDGSGATSWAHDQMGRIKTERRTIGAAVGDYETDTYNLDGSVGGLTVLGKSVAYVYKGAARPISAISYSTNPATNYVTSATYAPFGGLTSLVNGSTSGFTGITTTNAYNNRLQPILLSAASPSGSAFSLCYDFHLGVAVNSPPCSFSASTLGDNGNVYQVVNNRDNTRTQSFVYDSLNRISSGQSSGTQWGENYTIDAWGNLYSRSGVTGKTMTEGLSCGSPNINNQLSTCYNYDAAGNLIQNGSTTYTYDAENQLISTSGYAYIYDGDGQRVEKCTEGTTPGTCASGATGTLYWKGTASDAAMVETDLAGNLQNTYIFFGGQRVARTDSTGAVHYYFSDHLGTHAVIENATGTACEQDIDYYPYGGVEHDYCATLPQKYLFTGKERDLESLLDYFGARYHASNLGRFMSPDPESAGADAGDPQSWNGYSYVLNNPLNRVDPDGRGGCAFYIQNYTWNDGWHPSDVTGFFCDETQQTVQTATEAVRQWITAPRDPGCMAGAMAAGSGIGMVAGGAVGALGLAGGPTVAVTEPAGLQLGMTVGATAGGVVGFAKCKTGSGGSGGGGGADEDSSKQWKKLSPQEIEKLKEAGYDPHDLKPNSQYDLYKNQNGDISVFPKNNLNGPGDPTGIQIKNLVVTISE